VSLTDFAVLCVSLLSNSTSIETKSSIPHPLVPQECPQVLHCPGCFTDPIKITQPNDMVTAETPQCDFLQIPFKEALAYILAPSHLSSAPLPPWGAQDLLFLA
jgi:hypothetical protein